MYEMILPDLYRIEIPLPQSPLKSLNSYLIKGEGRSLIIDTGMNREECLAPMLKSLDELKVDLERTDFFITHLHADHLGQIGKLASESSRVYFSKIETEVVTKEAGEAETRFKEFFKFYVRSGFPEEELLRAFADHPGYKYRPRRKIEFSIVNDGDDLQIGGYSFKCIETPGHSPGHMCLYEPDKKIFISGDHILFNITPNITCWPELDDSLGSYLQSLEKVEGLDVELVLPGHRNTWNEHEKRIAELKQHHENRLAEVVEALKGGDKNAWEIAPYIRWDIKVNKWEEFPTVQKWFALGETLAHIGHLESKGVVKKAEDESRIVYSLA